VWRDTSDLHPGQDWKKEIRRAIDSGSLAFLACFSRNTESRTESYQNEELILAIDRMRMRPPGASWLIPIRFDDCSVPDFDLGNGRSLASLQRVDLFDETWPMLGRLIMAITRILSARHASMPMSTTRDSVGSGESGESWAESARRALNEGRNRYALTLVENGIKAQSLDASLQFLRGVSLRRLGRAAEAVEPLRLAHEIDPSDTAIRSELVDVLMDLDDYEEAHRISPEDAKPRYRENLLGKGLEGARSAYSLWPDDSIVKLQLARMLVAAKGTEHVRAAWQLTPRDREVEKSYIVELVQGELTDGQLREIADIYSSLSQEARSLLENKLIDKVSTEVAGVQARRPYDEDVAWRLVRRIDFLAKIIVTGPAALRVRSLRAQVYRSDGDAVTAGCAVGGCFVLVLVGFVVSGLFFASWANAALGALITFAVVGTILGRSFRKAALESDRRRRLESRKHS
jgi:hypothetical protein